MSTYIPFEIQVEIMKRIPVESLIRFRSVCKAWNSLIGSSQFIAAYNFHDTQSQRLIMISYKVYVKKEAKEVESVSSVDDEKETEDRESVSSVDDEKETKDRESVSSVDDEEETEDEEDVSSVDDEEETEDEEYVAEVKYVCLVDDDTFPQQKFVLAAPPLVQGTAIIGGSHGLLCLSDHYGDPDDTAETQTAVIWNPAIRKSVAIDVPNMVHQPFNSILSFGVCPDTKDPKLVKVTYIQDNTKIESISCIPHQVMVFTLRSREWTDLCGNLPRKSIRFTGFHTVIGRFIYWVAYDFSSFDGNSKNMIMSFDLSIDEFREVHLPDSLHHSNLTVSRLRESLVLLDFDLTTKNEVCDVWMMDHGDSKAFTKLYTINPPNASIERINIIGFRESGEPIIEVIYDVWDPISALAVYDPCLQHIKDIGICGDSFSYSGSSYTVSLLLLDHDDHDQIVRCGVVKR